MELLKKYKNILIVLVIIVLIFALYNFFFVGKQSSDDPLSSTTPSGLDASSPGNELLSLLQELKGIEFRTDIFNDPVFATLKDFGVTLVPQPVGRRNPFALIGSDGIASVTADEADLVDGLPDSEQQAAQDATE